MRSAERVSRLINNLSVIGQAAGEALADVRAIEQAETGNAVVTWLPELEDAIKRIQLECADERYATRELRELVPDIHALQPRLL